MIFSSQPISEVQDRPAHWDKFSPDLRGRTVAELRSEFRAVGAGPFCMVKVRSEGAAKFDTVKLKEVPDHAVYSGRTVQRGVHAFFPTFTIPSAQLINDFR